MLQPLRQRYFANQPTFSLSEVTLSHLPKKKTKKKNGGNFCKRLRDALKLKTLTFNRDDNTSSWICHILPWQWVCAQRLQQRETRRCCRTAWMSRRLQADSGFPTNYHPWTKAVFSFHDRESKLDTLRLKNYICRVSPPDFSLLI